MATTPFNSNPYAFLPKNKEIRQAVRGLVNGICGRPSDQDAAFLRVALMAQVYAAEGHRGSAASFNCARTSGYP